METKTETVGNTPCLHDPPEIGDLKPHYDNEGNLDGVVAWVYCKTCGKPDWVKHTRPRMLRGRRDSGSNGYVVVTMERDDPYFGMANRFGTTLEHRLVMARHLGRCLLPDEIVHHIDRNKSNNDINNLMIVTGSLHQTGNQWQKLARLQEDRDRLSARLQRVVQVLRLENTPSEIWVILEAEGVLCRSEGEEMYESEAYEYVCGTCGYWWRKRTPIKNENKLKCKSDNSCDGILMLVARPTKIVNRERLEKLVQECGTPLCRRVTVE